MRKLLITTLSITTLLILSTVVYGKVYPRDGIPESDCLEIRCPSDVCMEDENGIGYCCPSDSEKPKLGESCNECGCKAGSCVLPSGKLTGGTCSCPSGTQEYTKKNGEKDCCDLSKNQIEDGDCVPLCEGEALYQYSSTHVGGQGTSQCCNEDLITGRQNVLFTGYKKDQSTEYGCCPTERTYNQSCCPEGQEGLSSGCCDKEKIYIDKGVESCCKNGNINPDKTLCCTGGSVFCGDSCCGSGHCIDNTYCCAPGEIACGGSCCGSGQCIDNTYCCSPGQVACGGVCCASGQCAVNTCCEMGKTACGSNCCASDETCNISANRCEKKQCEECGSCEKCVDGECKPDYSKNNRPVFDECHVCFDGVMRDKPGTSACGGTCCKTGEYCAGGSVCCPYERFTGSICCNEGSSACGTICCNPGESCEGGVCKKTKIIRVKLGPSGCTDVLSTLSGIGVNSMNTGAAYGYTTNIWESSNIIFDIDAKRFTVTKGLGEAFGHQVQTGYSYMFREWENRAWKFNTSCSCGHAGGRSSSISCPGIGPYEIEVRVDY